MSEEQSAPITAKQLELIHDTWAMVDDHQQAGLIMFKKLFELKPSLYELFAFGDGGFSEENEKIRKHTLDVMTTVDTAIGLVVGSEIQVLVDTLEELGAAHHYKNITPNEFEPVGMALLHALSVVIGDQFTDEAKQAWATLYGVVQMYMVKGMEEAATADDE